MARSKLYYSGSLNPLLRVAVARHLRAELDYVVAQTFHPDHQEAFRKLNPMTRVQAAWPALANSLGC